MTKHIGIFGGSFDPIHNGHIAMALAAKEQFKLDEIHFVLAKQSPLKSKPKLNPEDRCKLLEEIANHLNQSQTKVIFHVSRIEIDREGPSYTYQTLKEYKKKYSGAELFLLIGADAFYDFSKWKNHTYIKENSNIIILPRILQEGDSPSNKQDLDVFLQESKEDPQIQILNAELVNIESKIIRKQIAQSDNKYKEFIPESIQDSLANLYS